MIRNEDKMQEQTFYDIYNYPDGSYKRKEYWKKHLSKHINFDFLKGKKVLDVGCGTGTISKVLFDAGADVYACDLSSKSIEYINQNYPEVKTQVADALNLPYANNEFDIVLSIGVLHHTGNTKKGFEECTRVCKPNRQLLILLYTKYHYYPLLYKGFELFRNGKKPENMPKWFIKGVKKFTELYYGEKRTEQDAIQLIADQFFTPIAEFHSEFEIKKLCKEFDLKLIKTSTTYLKQHKIYNLTKC